MLFRSILTVLCLISTYARTQPFSQLEFSFYDTENGLSNNVVNCFYQDKQGFLWIGTEDGLNRYDGYSFKVFQSFHGKKGALQTDRVIQILGDPNSNGFWINSVTSISYFDPVTEMVTDYTVGLYNGVPKDLSATNATLFYNQQGILCLINDNGISFFNTKLNRFVLHTIKSFKSKGRDVGIAGYFQEDEHHLILSSSNAILRYNIATHQYAYFDEVSSYISSKPGIKIGAMCKDNFGQIWLSSACYGLFILDLKTNVIRNVLVDTLITNYQLQNIITVNQPTKSGVFKDEMLVLGTKFYRIPVAAQKDFSSFTNFEVKIDSSKPELQKKISSSRVVYVGNNNISYVGTSFGFAVIDPDDQNFTIHNSNAKGVISCVRQKLTPQGKLRYFVSSYYNGGFYIFDDKFNLIKSYPHIPPDAKSPQSTNANALYIDNKNQLWICSHNGLYRYDETNERFIAFTYDSKNPKGIKSNSVYCMLQDHNGLYWIGFGANGYCCFNSEKDSFYDFHIPSKFNNGVYGFNIIEDAQHNIWLGSDRGVQKINADRTKIAKYFYDKNNPNGISFGSIESMYCDRQNRLWLGTENGLNLYQPSTNTFKKYYRETGLYSNRIYGLTQDKYDNLWIASGSSFSVFNLKTQKTIFVRAYNASAIYKDTCDNIIIGTDLGGNGILTYNENSNSLSGKLPKPVITELIYNDIDQKQIHVNAIRLSNIELNYNQNYLSFAFAGISFTNAAYNQFKTRLFGLEEKWNLNGTKRVLTYAALPPGRYEFEVMCSNPQGNWNTEKAKLVIIIHPPFWETWWFKSILALCFATLVYLIYQIRINTIRKEVDFKNKLLLLKNEAIIAQMNPHFIFNALNSIQACIVNNNNDDAYNYLNKFSMLVRSILQNSRSQFIDLSVELEALKNYLDLEILRFKDLKYTITVDTQINPAQIKVPSSFMQPFVENAVIHGLAHKHGDKLIQLIITKDESNVLFKIIDNGIGRRKAEALNESRSRSHTSLGMTLTASRIKLISEQYHCNSEIVITDLNDEFGKACGTEVLIKLPLEIQLEWF